MLLLLPSLYMLQVYDRVLSSGSESTLLMLTLIATFLFILMGGSGMGALADPRRDERAARRAARGPRLRVGVPADARDRRRGRPAAQPLGDLLQLRQFLTGPGLFAFFDAPWLPLYVALMFMFHPVLGVVAIAARRSC